MARNKKTKKKSLEDENLESLSSEDEPTAEPEVVNETTPEDEAAKSSEDAARPMEPKPSPRQTPVPKPEPEQAKPLVRLEVFLKVAGPKWDQLAGFKLYAKKQGLGRLSIPEWREELQKFMSKPTG